MKDSRSYALKKYLVTVAIDVLTFAVAAVLAHGIAYGNLLFSREALLWLLANLLFAAVIFPVGGL